MSDLKETSVINLYKLMLEAASGDGEYSWLTSKCGNQSKLAGIERKSADIMPMSLNTFKAYADECIDGGFCAVNALRKSLSAKSKKKSESASSKLKSMNRNYKEQLEESERMRAVLVKAYSDLNRICLDAVKKSPEYFYELERHNALYDQFFSLNLVSNE